MSKIPKRWRDYTSVGRCVLDTKFLPFKVPLKMELLSNRIPEVEWFTPSMLLQKTPQLRAIVDLTNTDRYYNPQEFTRQGILYKKLPMEGHGKLPSQQDLLLFFDVVDEFLQRLNKDEDALIGVHCTHGLNRTGYLICKYLVSRMKIDPDEAIRKFQEARGHPIERNIYIRDIKCTINRHEFIKRSYNVSSTDSRWNRYRNDSFDRYRNDSFDRYRNEHSHTNNRYVRNKSNDNPNRRRDSNDNNYKSRDHPRPTSFYRNRFWQTDASKNSTTSENWRLEPRRQPSRPEKWRYKRN